MKVHLISLGCPKNWVDSEVILGGLKAHGLEIVSNAAEADVLIVNTCGFIEDAKKESVEAIFEAVQLKKMGRCRVLFVTGCLSQRYPEALEREISEVDGFFGAQEVESIVQAMAQKLQLSHPGVTSYYRRYRMSQGPYAYLKIAEGCDNLCSFCAIPFIRGKHRSRPLGDILREAEELVASGVKELIVVSQDTTLYGRDLGEGITLVDVLEGLSGIEGVRWIRLHYVYPDRITDELIECIAQGEKICKYVDVPIQHISDRILRRMKRGSRRATIERLIETLRARIPEVALRTTVMVGFPGETERDFQELYDFLSEAQFDHLGVFMFSPEEGTEAYHYPDSIPEEVKRERYEALMGLHQAHVEVLNRRLIGKELVVLVDDSDRESGMWVGRTSWDSPEIDRQVMLQGKTQVGAFVRARIISTSDYDLFGVVLNNPMSSEGHSQRAYSTGLTVPVQLGGEG